MSFTATSIIHKVTKAFRLAFPDRVKAIYVVGSYAGDYAVAGSDIDFVVIFAGSVTEDEQTQANALTHTLRATIPVELDIGIQSEYDEARPALVMASTLVYGEDIRKHLKMMSLEYWIRERLHAGCYLICNVFGKRRKAMIPMTFPNSATEFFGYTTARGGSDVETTKNLVRASSWAATALTARASQQFITSKMELLSQCSKYLDGRWAIYINDLFQLCREDLHYRLPTSSAQRQRLKAICERNREFETFYLETYRSFLLDELSADTGRKRQALDFLALTAFYDPKIQTLIEHIQRVGAPNLVVSASQALTAIQRYCE